MSQAKEILDQRLARGEIGEEEYERLAARIKSPPVAEPAPAYAASPNVSTAPKKKNQWGWFVGGAVAVVAFIAYQNSQGISGLTVGNIAASGTTVQFRVANTNSTAKDALFWVEQGFEKCVTIAKLKAQTSQTLSMPCATLASGEFTLRWVWASEDIDKANIASRIQGAS